MPYTSTSSFPLSHARAHILLKGKGAAKNKQSADRPLQVQVGRAQWSVTDGVSHRSASHTVSQGTPWVKYQLSTSENGGVAGPPFPNSHVWSGTPGPQSQLFSLALGGIASIWPVSLARATTASLICQRAGDSPLALRANPRLLSERYTLSLLFYLDIPPPPFFWSDWCNLSFTRVFLVCPFRREKQRIGREERCGHFIFQDETFCRFMQSCIYHRLRDRSETPT